MKYIPHSYQQYCIDFIKKNKVVALLLDVGLGKTSITLTSLFDLLFDEFKISKVLVIAPLRVATISWSSEIKKWDHLKMLSYSLAVGSEQERLKALQKRCDITIINRENVEWLVNKTPYGENFDTLVVDELSSFKSASAKRFRSLMRIRPLFERVIGLTATPIPNGLMDLWSEFKVLDMGKRLGTTLTFFRNKWFLKEQYPGMSFTLYKPKSEAESEIYKSVKDITISMKANDKIKMPSLIIDDVKVYMSGSEKEKYKELKKNLRETIKTDEVNETITSVNAAVLSNKLSQMANGTIYSDDHKSVRIHNRKLDALLDIVEQANGHSVLVAYWYKQDAERIKEALSEKNIECSELKTIESIEKWNKGEVNVGLIHPESAGHGLNLQYGGSHLVYFSLPWSLEYYTQTIGRLYRQGQNKTVVVQRLITDGTIDERIKEALNNKNTSSEALRDALNIELKEENI